MTMLSFRVPDREAVEAQEWADRLGLDRSELLRDALHRHIVALCAQQEPERYDALPVSDQELAISAGADWGPAEDWSDWATDAPR